MEEASQPQSMVPMSNIPLSLPLYLSKLANEQTINKLTSSIEGILKSEGSATAVSNNYLLSLLFVFKEFWVTFDG